MSFQLKQTQKLCVYVPDYKFCILTITFFIYYIFIGTDHQRGGATCCKRSNILTSTTRHCILTSINFSLSTCPSSWNKHKNYVCMYPITNFAFSPSHSLFTTSSLVLIIRGVELLAVKEEIYFLIDPPPDGYCNLFVCVHVRTHTWACVHCFTYFIKIIQFCKSRLNTVIFLHNWSDFQVYYEGLQFTTNHQMAMNMLG